MTRAYLSLGTNLGDRLRYLTESVRLLTVAHTRISRASSVYETAPQGKTDQPNFLNIVIEIDTDLGPRALLEHIQGVERSQGRIRRERWGPRTIDVDLVLYGEENVLEEGLTVPHPRMHERAFVLVPLLEINPQSPYRAQLSALPDQEVRLFLGAASFMSSVSRVQ